jgi:hypothetical protein
LGFGFGCWSGLEAAVPCVSTRLSLLDRIEGCGVWEFRGGFGFGCWSGLDAAVPCVSTLQLQGLQGKQDDHRP